MNSTAAADAPSPPHVLLVDDEAISALALERFLARKGYRVSVAGNGHQALALHQADPVDAVVTDMRMPKMDGGELLRRLRADRPALPAVVVTGYMAGDPQAAGLDSPRTRLMTKPVDPVDLLKTLKQLLEG